MTDKKKVEAKEGEKGDERKVEDIISKISINKYDPYQLKSSIDEEIVSVSSFIRILFLKRVLYRYWKKQIMESLRRLQTSKS